MMDSLSPKDRTAIRRGGIAVAVMLLWIFGVRPVTSSIQNLSARVNAQREMLTRELEVLESVASYAEGVEVGAERLRDVAPRLFGGETDGVAAANLAEYVQGAAQRSQALLTRLDPSGVELVSTGVESLSASVYGESDVEGLLTLLYLLEGGEKLIHITGLRVQTSRMLGAIEVITFEFTVTGFQLADFAEGEGEGEGEGDAEPYPATTMEARS